MRRQALPHPLPARRPRSRVPDGGSFPTRAEALTHKRFIDGELAGGCVPVFDLAADENQLAPRRALRGLARAAHRRERALPVLALNELEDGTSADAPTIRSAAGVTWKPGDTIPLGARMLRVVTVRDGHADQAPVLVVEEPRTGD